MGSYEQYEILKQGIEQRRKIALTFGDTGRTIIIEPHSFHALDTECRCYTLNDNKGWYSYPMESYGHEDNTLELTDDYFEKRE